MIVGTAGPEIGSVSTTDVGVVALWLAAVLTLVTGYDYLRAGLRHFQAHDEPETDPAPETDDGKLAKPRSKDAA